MACQLIEFSHFDTTMSEHFDKADTAKLDRERIVSVVKSCVLTILLQASGKTIWITPDVLSPVVFVCE